MISGLWSVRYHGPQGDGGGVVVLESGRLLGGDSGYTYSGSYREEGDRISAEVDVANFDNSIRNVLGIPGNFKLLIEGKLTGNDIKGIAALAGMPDSKVVVTITKRVDI